MFIILITIVISLLTIAFFTIAERKLLASIQYRWMSDVANFWGILQAFADGLKLLFLVFYKKHCSNKQHYCWSILITNEISDVLTMKFFLVLLITITVYYYNTWIIFYIVAVVFVYSLIVIRFIHKKFIKKDPWITLTQVYNDFIKLGSDESYLEALLEKHKIILTVLMCLISAPIGYFFWWIYY